LPISTHPANHVVHVGGFYFEDLKQGQSFRSAPAITITEGHAAVHAALFGDRLRLALDSDLCRSVTGRPALAHPNLVCNIAIGQSTEPTQFVRGNLFYRGLLLHKPVFVGDTLTTTTEVVALRQNRRKPDRDATGMAVLQVHVENQHRDTVLHFWRCPMLPCRNPDADTGANDSFDSISDDLPITRLAAAIPDGWDLEQYSDSVPGAHFADHSSATQFIIDSYDTVTCAPELARMTMNLASAHTDASASAYGRRLVYGGHTISMASAQVTRVLPNLITIVGWRGCEHPAPVFEGDRIRTELLITAMHSLPHGWLVDLHATAYADRGENAHAPGRDVPVLEWRFVGLMA
jgi:2-methylfumaryl-CoA hydratase